jgi:hypothetical protein
MTDYLDEDPVINSQKFCVISYVLPQEVKNGKTVMLKVRGTFSSPEDANNHIKKLQKIDKYFNLYLVEVGKWGALLTPEEIKKLEVDTVYNNETLNEFMKDYKAQKDKSDLEFEQRKIKMAEKVREDGTKEGQKRLAEQKENPLSIKKRLEDSETFISQIKAQLEECEEVRTKAIEKLKDYTEEEIAEAEEKIKALEI